MKIKTTEEISALDLILKKYPKMSKQKAKKIIKYSTFLIDGKAVHTIPSTIFPKDQEIEILKDTVTKFTDQHPEKNRPIVIKYEDKYFIIAIKPAGLLSCKNETQKGNSFDKMLEEYVSKRDKKKTRLWIAHRIDREVEGLIIFAKTEEDQQMIKDQWQNVTKKYLALTEGKPNPESGFIESWLKDGYRHKMKVFKKEVEGSQFAKTEYKYLKKVGKYHLLEITLHTGRKNQIRAHLSSIGCPIVGDYTYDADASVVRQIRLVAYNLKFKHPKLDKDITLEYEPKSRFYSPSQKVDENYKI